MSMGTNHFDKECIERYGKRTCMIVRVAGGFEMRLLDKLEGSQAIAQITSNVLHKLIPQMLRYKYTVVIVEKINGQGSEIIAIHHPVQSQLTTPPIIQ